MATEENYWQRKLRLDDERIKREKALAKMREASEKAKGEGKVLSPDEPKGSSKISKKYPQVEEGKLRGVPSVNKDKAEAAKKTKAKVAEGKSKVERLVERAKDTKASANDPRNFLKKTETKKPAAPPEGKPILQKIKEERIAKKAAEVSKDAAKKEAIKKNNTLLNKVKASQKQPEVVKKRPASPSKAIAEKYKNPNAPKTPSVLNQLASKRAAEKVAQETAAAQRAASMQPISERAAAIRQATASPVNGTVPAGISREEALRRFNAREVTVPKPANLPPSKGLVSKTANTLLNNPVTRGVAKVARVAGPAATAYQLYDAGSELVRQQDERVQRLADEESMKAERAKLIQAKGKRDTTGVGGNFARMIERGGKVPDNVKEEVPYTPASTQEQLRATDPIKQDYGMMGEISKALTGSEEGLANMGVPDMLANKRKEIESQAETALKAGTVKPEQVGNQAVINENQKRQSQGSPTTTQEEATKIKADTERTFKELGFDGQKALMTGLGLAAIAVGMKQDPRGTIQGLAEGLETRRLEGIEDTKLKGQEAARLRAEALKISENAKDRKNALDIANARIKAARDAASQKGSPKNPDITSKVAQEMVAAWAEENDIEMTPDKLTSFAEQVRSHYNENPSFVGQDPSKIISSFAKPRTEKKSWGFLPWNNTQTFR